MQCVWRRYRLYEYFLIRCGLDYVHRVQITIDGLARVMCMSEYLEREFVAVPRLPLLSECAPLAAAVAGSSAGRRGRPVPRYTDATRQSTEDSGAVDRRPNWRFVRLRLGKTGRPIVEEQQQLEMTADDLPSTSACGTAVAGESSRPTTDSEPDQENNQQQRRRREPEPSSAGDSNTAGTGGRETGGGGRVKLSTLESDVREVRRILQAYALRLSERDAHARITKQWRLVARVLDRLFFFFYCATIMVSLATIFPRPR